MPLYTRDGVRVLFVHIPKTGGTSIEAAFRRAGFEESFFARSHGPYGCTPQHMVAADLLHEFGSIDFDYVFGVVRDPMARLASERSWRAGHQVKAGRPVPSYDAFVSEWLNRLDGSRTAGDNHFRPQVDFLLPHMQVFRFEDGLSTILARVARRLRVRRLARVPPHKMPRRVQADVAPESLSDATTARLVRTYVTDYAVLGYDLPPPHVTGTPMSLAPPSASSREPVENATDSLPSSLRKHLGRARRNVRRSAGNNLR